MTTIPNTKLVLIEDGRAKAILAKLSDLLSIRNERREEFYDEVEQLMSKFSENAVTLSDDTVNEKEIEIWKDKKYGDKNSFKTN